MKVALVCDWLTNVGGAEKVLLEIHRLFPDAPIYTSKYDKKGIDWFLDADVRTGWLQIFPSKLRRFLGVFRQKWFEHLDLSEYDLVISVTGAEAKSVKVPNGKHICYCHVPTQYYWQMYDDYVKNPGFGILNPLVRFFFKLFVKPLRKADYEGAKHPDVFVTISEYAREQIRKYYDREAVVVHPPVEIKDFAIKLEKKQIKQGNKNEKSQEQGCSQAVENSYYITTSRQVNWKRIDLVVEACAALGRELVVIGEGPEHKKLLKLAKGCKNIKFLPVMKKSELKKWLMGAKGYLFPSLEPFGIAPVEALAAGCPVVAFYEGGAKDYIKAGENGVFFKSQTVAALKKAILEFEKMNFDREKVSRSVADFGVERFDKEILKVVNEKNK